MKTPKIDFTKIVATVAGHAAGGIAVTQLNKLKFMQAYNDPTKQVAKGLIIAGLGYIGIPFALDALGMAGKLKGLKADFAQATSQGMGFIGTMILGNAVIKPKNGGAALFPAISDDVAGMDYENEMAGLGMINDEDYVNGYEQDPTMAGYEQNPMLAGELEEVL